MRKTVVDTRIADSVRELYRVFKPFRVRRHPEGCPCCVSDADKRRLFSKPLEELTADDLARFAWSALLTWGSVEDLKHFLPRLMELIAINECAPLEREVLLGTLRLAEWKAWPERERDALVEFLNAAWFDCLSSQGGSVWLDELLCGLGRAVDNLRPYLERWSECRLRTAYEHLVQYVDENQARLLKRRHLANSFWSNAEPQMLQVVEWLLSPKTSEGLERLFRENADAEFSDALAAAIDRLNGLRQSLNAK